VKETKVTQPDLIRKYNEGMGGVDVLDRMLASYRPRFRSKKWWWNLFSNGVNMAVVAAFRFYLYLHPDSTITHLQFRRTVTMALLKSQQARIRLGGPTSPTPNDIRYDGVNHHLESSSQGRCTFCMANTRLQCVKCKKRLHKLCSGPYHTRPE